MLDILRQGNYSTTRAKNMRKDTKSNLKNSIFLAKTTWTSHLAKKLYEMSGNPKYSWKAVNTLKE